MEVGKLSCKLSAAGSLRGSLVAGASIKAEVIGRAETYTGDYVVTPKVEEQSMATANKRMKEDVLIKGVPKYEVSNNSGTTVYIAKEVYDGT